MKQNIEFVAGAMPLQQLCQDVLIEKYAAPGESTVQEIQERVATALGGDAETKARFLGAFEDGMVPGGRINSAAGLNRVSTMINCFVQPVGDSTTGENNGVPSIFSALAQSAETMRRGGGVGYDFTPIRPKDARVKGTDSRASGPLSYMRVFDRMCQTIESAGGRRGAQMGVLRVDHPDIELFIDAKKMPDFEAMGLDAVGAKTLADLIAQNSEFGWEFRKAFAQLSNFNISVAVTDAFMEAVNADADFDLVHEAIPAFDARTIAGAGGTTQYVYRTVKAVDIWNKILRNTYDGAEPGVIFIDQVNRDNNLRYCETIVACNPCGEQYLPPHGCCCLGSVNLTKFVSKPFTVHARFDFERFAETVAVGVEVLDTVLDKTHWPLVEQASEAMNKRRIGQGYFGLADAMAMLGYRYDSPEGVEFARQVAEWQRDAAYLASVELAKKLGAFPFFDAEKYLEEGTAASRLPQDIKDQIRQHGIRNSHLLSIAPTGTISMAFGNNASSGIEPIYSLRQKRNKIMADGSRQEFYLEDYAYKQFKQINGEDAKSDVFVTAMQMSVADHLNVLGAAAGYVDSAISKTVNVPADYPFEDFKMVYMDAWKMKLKGITTYRPNAITGAVLVSADDHQDTEAVKAPQLREDDPDRRVELKEVPHITEVLRWPNRPDVPAEGITYSVKHPQGRFAVVVNHWRNGGMHPLEVYIAGNEQPRGLAAIAKALSVDMRTDDGAWLAMKLDSLLDTEGDDRFEMIDPATGTMVMMPSLAAGFASIVKHRLTEIGALEGQSSSPMMDALFSRREPKTTPQGGVCWGVDIKNHATGDDFTLFTKELVLPGGQVRPYSMWLSGKYPKVLDGLMKTLSIDMRISDPAWVAMKLRKMTSFGEVRGDFLAEVPGSKKQQSYSSTVAYVATVLLARMEALGLITGETSLAKATSIPDAAAESTPVKVTGRQCPKCKSMSLHKRAGCEACDNCGYEGSCG